MKKAVSLVLSLLLAFTMVFTVVGCGKTETPEVKLQAIGITKKPTKLTYTSGEKFDPTGMEVSAKYSDKSVKKVTGYDYDKKGNLTEDDTSVTVKYTEGSVTKTASLTIKVNPGTDHVKYHEFKDGKCSCGAILFEAEDAHMEGTPTDGNDTFIVNTDKASGGKVIGNWRNGDDRWTVYVNSEKEIKDLTIGLRYAPTGSITGGTFYLPTTDEEASRDYKSASQIMWAYEMRLNGKIVSWQRNVAPDFNGSDYFVFTTLLTNGLTLNAGENKLELESWDSYGMNIDYVFFNTAKDTTLTFSAEEKNPAHKHAFTEGKCSCGAVLGEAEDCKVTGTIAGYGQDKDGFYRPASDGSNGKKVGAWGEYNDNKIFVNVNSDAEYAKVKMGFVVQTAGYIENSNGFTMYKYDAEKDEKGASIGHESLSSGWDKWTTVLSDEFTLAKGLNSFVLESFANTVVDFDYFFIEGIGKDSVVTFEKYVAPAPDPDEHTTHTFTDGKCSCGALKFEAEDCEVTGTPSYTTGFYREDASLSGGKKVGGFGDHGDNKIFVKLNSDKAYENVTVSFCISTGGIATSEGFVFYNQANKSATISHGTVAAGISGWTMNKSSAFSLGAGENVFVIEAYENCQVDFDYFVMEGLPVSAVVTLEKYVEPAPDPEEHTTHTFTDGKCSCGAVKIEAEDCEVIGTPASWAGDQGFYRSSDGLSGGKKVGAWGVNGDNRIYIKFTSDKAYENVTMTFRISTGGVVTATAFDFYFSETKSTKIGHPALSGGMGWTDIKSDAFSIKAGENFLVLEAYQNCEVDWDYFVIEGLPADAQITVTKAA